MGFVSLRDKRQYDQTAVFQESYQADPTFGQTFGAGVGMAFDEGLSISSTLNREGFRERKLLAERLIDEGTIDKDKYFVNTRRGSEFDWDSLSKDVDEIKSDTELNEERNKMLADRRAYGQDILERGSGLAGFLGGAAGYMLDPISIATMPIGYSTAGLKGLAAVSRAATRVGAVELATETAIQGFVLDHKRDIDAPYDWKDAITAMSTAAVGGAMFGAVGAGAKELLSKTKFGSSDIANADVGGILEYIRGVRKKVGDLPQDPSLDVADETLARLEETLTNNPLRTSVTVDPIDIDVEKAKFLDEVKEELLGGAGNKIERGEVKKLTAEKKELELKISRLDESPLEVIKTKGVSARKAKKQAQDVAKSELDADVATLKERLTRVESLLERNKKASADEADLTRAEQGIIPDRYKNTWDTVQKELEVKQVRNLKKALVKADADYLEGLETRRTQRQPTPEVGQAPVEKVSTDGAVSERERMVLDKAEETENFAQDIAKYNERFKDKALSDVTILMDDVTVNPKEYIDNIDAEIDGLDSITMCLSK